MDYHRALFPDEMYRKLLKKGFTEADLKPRKLDKESWAAICRDSLLQDFWLASPAHAVHVDAHLKREEAERNNAQKERDRYLHEMWAGNLPKENAATMGVYEDQRRWIADFPQFVPTGEHGTRNLEAIAAALAEHNWLPN